MVVLRTLTVILKAKRVFGLLRGRYFAIACVGRILPAVGNHHAIFNQKSKMIVKEKRSLDSKAPRC